VFRQFAICAPITSATRTIGRRLPESSSTYV
jgi:hypothetical protein